MILSQPSDDSAQKKVPYHFGEKLRQVRENKGYTLKYVAQKAGVSESLVSQIEHNHVSPAIDTLLSLADILDINLEYLFEEYRKKRPVTIIRSNERSSFTEDEIQYEELSKSEDSDKENSIESYIVTIPAGSHTHHGSYGHLGRELGFIIQGKARLTFDEKVYELNEGDSVSYSASVPHLLENIGETELKAIWTLTPAQRFIK